MSKGEKNIYKRKDGRWEGRYIKERINGKIRYGYVYRKTYEEVKERLEIISENAGGKKFSIISEQWLKNISLQLKASSIAKYKNILKNHLNPAFGNTNISDITKSDTEKFCMALLAEGGKGKRGLSPRTVLSVLAVLKSIFKFASVCCGISVQDLSGVYIRQNIRKPNVLSSSEQKRLTDYLIKNLDGHTLGIIICLFMGLRIGEICALKWKNILFDEKCIIVEKTLQRIQLLDGGIKKTRIIITEPKSISSVRKVPIPKSIYTYIKSMRREDDAFLLTGSKTRFTEPRSLENKFKRIIKDCRLDYVNFHALRHTFATNCIELGFDIKSLSEILGHSNVNITLNRYVHPSMNLKKRNMDMLVF